jgi:hypothetical protein
MVTDVYLWAPLGPLFQSWFAFKSSVKIAVMEDLVML